jgi:hypothetical protein
MNRKRAQLRGKVRSNGIRALTKDTIPLGGKAAERVDPILLYIAPSQVTVSSCRIVGRPPFDRAYRNVFTPLIIYSSYITLFLHSFYTRSHPTDLETYRWGLLHAFDRHLVPNECPDVVDSVPMCSEFPVLSVRVWAKQNIVDRIHT